MTAAAIAPLFAEPDPEPTDSKGILRPSADVTFIMVAKVGSPPSVSALYGPSRPIHRPGARQFTDVARASDRPGAWAMNAQSSPASPTAGFEMCRGVLGTAQVVNVIVDRKASAGMLMVLPFHCDLLGAVNCPPCCR